MKRFTEDLFWSKVQKDEGCWLWTGVLDRYGYGRQGREGRSQLAHRIAYELTFGPIADGMVIDHLCRTRSCVNPDHMEAVTFQENINRGLASPTKTHCANGHEFDEDNTRFWKGRRLCRPCEARRSREYQARRRGVSA